MRVVSPLSKPLVGAGVAPLMFRCAIVVGLVFLLRMSKSESAPLMPVRTEQRGGAAAVQEAEKDRQLVEAAAPAAAARQQRGIAAYLTGEVTDNDGGHKPKRPTTPLRLRSTSPGCCSSRLARRAAPPCASRACVA